MLEINVPGGDLYDEATNTFYSIKPTTLHLEHSLISVSKWEQKWHKPFLAKTEKTNEEIIDYIRCMTLDNHVDYRIYYNMSTENYQQVDAYIKDPMTATTFRKDPMPHNSREIITNEIIYYWMTELNIPPEYAKWHLNRLLTLIQVASIKKSPDKKMSRRDILNSNRSLNAARRAALNSKG